MAELARLLIEDVFRLSPPRGLVVRGPHQGVFDAGAPAVVVRPDGQRIACAIADVYYVVTDERNYLNVALDGLPEEMQPEPGDVLELNARAAAR